MRWFPRSIPLLMKNFPIALHPHSSLNQGSNKARCFFRGDIEGKHRKGFSVDFHWGLVVYSLTGKNRNPCARGNASTEIGVNVVFLRLSEFHVEQEKKGL
jgi:hypothetical protein